MGAGRGGGSGGGAGSRLGSRLWLAADTMTVRTANPVIEALEPGLEIRIRFHRGAVLVLEASNHFGGKITLQSALLGIVRVLEDGGQANEVGVVAGERRDP